MTSRCEFLVGETSRYEPLDRFNLIGIADFLDIACTYARVWYCYRSYYGEQSMIQVELFMNDFFPVYTSCEHH